MHPPIITATELQNAEEPAPARRGPGRPRKHPPGTRPKQGPKKRAAPPVKAFPPSPDVRARWQAAADARGVSLSAFVTAATTAAAAFVSSLLGCKATPSTGSAGEGGSGGEGGAGGAGGLTITPTIAPTASIDTCEGCRLGGVGGPCVEPSKDYCGAWGSECFECPPPGECEIGLCLDGRCVTLDAADGQPCSVGICTAGVCGN